MATMNMQRGVPYEPGAAVVHRQDALAEARELDRMAREQARREARRQAKRAHARMLDEIEISWKQRRQRSRKWD